MNIKNMRISFSWLLVLLFIVFGCIESFAGDAELTVCAAASTTGPIMDISKLFKEKTGITIKSSFASSGVLARQIEQGNPADVFISASKKWADYAKSKGLLKADTRTNILTNTLVMIIPKDGATLKDFAFSKDYNFPEKLSGRLSIGNPEHVPAGKYAQQSLTALGWWQGLQDKLILSKDVRSALRVVEVGEADYGIVYGSDAKKSPKVEVAGVFPDSTHKPIVYVIAEVEGANADAGRFIDFLFSDEAGKIFAEYGFVPVKRK